MTRDVEISERVEGVGVAADVAAIAATISDHFMHRRGQDFGVDRATRAAHSWRAAGEDHPGQRHSTAAAKTGVGNIALQQRPTAGQVKSRRS